MRDDRTTDTHGHFSPTELPAATRCGWGKRASTILPLHPPHQVFKVKRERRCMLCYAPDEEDHAPKSSARNFVDLQTLHHKKTKNTQWVRPPPVLTSKKGGEQHLRTGLSSNRGLLVRIPRATVEGSARGMDKKFSGTKGEKEASRPITHQ